MKYKQGDKVLCKRNYFNDNNVVDIIFVKGDSYIIGDYDSFLSDYFGVDIINVIHENEKYEPFSFGLKYNLESHKLPAFWKLNNYFYTKEEERKMKLERLNG